MRRYAVLRCHHDELLSHRYVAIIWREAVIDYVARYIRPAIISCHTCRHAILRAAIECALSARLLRARYLITACHFDC